MTIPNLANLDLISEAWVDAVTAAGNEGDTLTAGGTPTFGNVTGGAAACSFVRFGTKVVLVRAFFTAGTATAAAAITITLPGLPPPAAVSAPVLCSTGSKLVHAVQASGTNVITIASNADGAAWGAGNSVAGLRLYYWYFAA